MKKLWAIILSVGILIVAGALCLSFILIFPPEFKQEWKVCEQDADCVLADQGFCGLQISVNKEYLRAYENYLSRWHTYDSIKSIFEPPRIYSVCPEPPELSPICKDNKCENIEI